MSKSRPKNLYRKSDSKASRSGAKRIQSARPQIIDLIVRYVRSNCLGENPMTAEEIADAVWEQNGRAGKVSSYRKRVGEAADENRIQKCDDSMRRRCQITDALASVYWFEVN